VLLSFSLRHYTNGLSGVDKWLPAKAGCVHRGGFASRLLASAIIPRVPALSMDTVVVRRSEPITREVDGELVMLDPRQSMYFALDSIGRRIWDLLEQPQQVDALCRMLGEEFDAPAETCRTDVLAFLAELADADLVSIG
jgi:hypothetical protein